MEGNGAEWTGMDWKGKEWRGKEWRGKERNGFHNHTHLNVGEVYPLNSGGIGNKG